MKLDVSTKIAIQNGSDTRSLVKATAPKYFRRAVYVLFGLCLLIWIAFNLNSLGSGSFSGLKNVIPSVALPDDSWLWLISIGGAALIIAIATKASGNTLLWVIVLATAAGVIHLSWFDSRPAPKGEIASCSDSRARIDTNGKICLIRSGEERFFATAIHGHHLEFDYSPVFLSKYEKEISNRYLSEFILVEKPQTYAGSTQEGYRVNIINYNRNFRSSPWERSGITEIAIQIKAVPNTKVYLLNVP